jgi:serine/threonine-protein kinase
MASPIDDPMVGRTIAKKYVVESFIGRGGMGAVYKAKQISLDKLVAIKVLHGKLVSDATSAARFQREAKAASRLDHPNSMRVLDYGRDSDGLCYIAMELLEGRSLFQILREARGPLTPERTVNLLRQVLAALALAHDMGVIHRDLKPENIIVVPTRGDEGEAAETVKVCDFGMAKILQNESAPESNTEKLTTQGIVVGTPEYMSPEQGRGVELDARSDLYAVGVMLYLMLAGKLPFQGESPLQILLKHVTDEPQPPSNHNPGVHPGLEAVCLRALRKAPDDRFASAREMRAALQVALKPETRSGHSDVPTSYAAPAARDPSESHVVTRPRAPTLAAPVTLSALPEGLPDSALADDDLLPAGSSTAPTTPTEGPPPAMSPARTRVIDVVEPTGSMSSPSPVAIAVAVSLALGVGSWLAFRKGAVPPPPAVAGQTAQPRQEPPPPEPSVQAAPSPVTGGASAPLVDAAPVAVKQAAVASAAARTKPTSIDRVSFSQPTAAPSAASIQTTPAPSPAPTIVVPPPLTLAPPTGSFDRASVALGAVRSKRAQSGDVLAAMPGGRFNQCYRDGLRAHGSISGLRGAGTLRLVFGSDGHVSEASFLGPVGFETIGQCVAGSATGANIRNVERSVDPGGDGAEVDLAFNPE